MDRVILGFEWYLVFLFSIVLHEASHALAALRLGDPTAYHGGQVTLDPLPHIKRAPFGTVVAPIASFLIAGWMIGWASAPYDRLWALRYPRRAAAMALAGPIANLLLVIAAAVLIRGGIAFGFLEAPERVNFTHLVAARGAGIGEWAAVMLSILFTLNLIFFVFNLLPLPPLDGSGVVAFFMHPDFARRYLEFTSSPAMSFAGIMISWRVFDRVFDPVHLFMVNLLYAGAAHYG
jgi:Zn-dependent protease